VFTYYANKVTLGYHLPLPWWSLTLDADANHEWRRYDEPNPNDRRDRTWEWSLTLGKKWTDSLSSSLQVKRQQTGSTVASFSRRRYVYGAKLKYAF